MATATKQMHLQQLSEGVNSLLSRLSVCDLRIVLLYMKIVLVMFSDLVQVVVRSSVTLSVVCVCVCVSMAVMMASRCMKCVNLSPDCVKDTKLDCRRSSCIASLHMRTSTVTDASAAKNLSTLYVTHAHIHRPYALHVTARYT